MLLWQLVMGVLNWDVRRILLGAPRRFVRQILNLGPA